MAKANTEWAVHPHDAIEKLAENVWRVSATLPGMPLRRAMTVMRRKRGELVIHNAIALEDAAMRELETWGTPESLLVPNGYHRLDAPAFKKRYPHLKVYAPRGSRSKVEEVVAVDGTYDEFPSDDDVCLETLRGVKHLEGAMVVRSNDGVTLVLNDVVFNMDDKPGLHGWIFRNITGSSPGPRVTRLAKLAFVKDKSALREDLMRLASTPGLVRLIVAHEKMAVGPEAASALRSAASYL